ncbi:hypothetical protein EFA69_04005 [Rufibacter immobilis]|uniref:Adhesin domain-containing protein n=1 Tax=Rufibacter immobilis TaxID=1348778 RepID=A0A3M9N3X1_9BACT|nr:hypothetical protein [Rufibacter immobilis]RNI32494.1 hypothetical protein EFA69_04005 [Rufibacter immobilis]
MRNLLMAALLLWGSLAAHAQKKVVEKTFALPASKKVNLNLPFANDVKLTAWDKNEALVKVCYEINGGKLNEAFVLRFEDAKDQLNVLADLRQELFKDVESDSINCPDGYRSNFGNYNTKTGRATSFACTRIDYEIFLPRHANVTLETITGDVEARGLTGPIQAKSISGFVDIDWPTQQGAAVQLKTITGEVYSDLEIALHEQRPEAPLVGYDLNGKLKEGGPVVRLESISNDVYFRRKK